jgi:hypothetical protein
MMVKTSLGGLNLLTSFLPGLSIPGKLFKDLYMRPLVSTGGFYLGVGKEAFLHTFSSIIRQLRVIDLITFEVVGRREIRETFK